MDLITLLLAALGILGSIVAFFLVRLLHRIEKMEEDIRYHVTEKEVRRLIDDKIDPLKERMDRIETKIDEIITLLVRGIN